MQNQAEQESVQDKDIIPQSAVEVLILSIINIFFTSLGTTTTK